MKRLSLVLLLMLFSCSDNHNLIYYSYNNTTVTRIDRGNEIYFYFGRLRASDPLPKPDLKATYRGRDGIMDAYLIIGNQDVEIINLGDSFERISPNKKMRLKEFKSNPDFIKWKEQHGKDKNIYRLSDAIDHEIKINAENHSGVKAEYDVVK
jgi:hypothetical protein